MKVFLTGAAGFIGFHAAKRLLERGDEVLGFDVVNNYYNPRFKYQRLEELRSHDRFRFIKADLCDREAMDTAWKRFEPDHVMHLAAQAGVRYSLENPIAYIHSNVVGFQHVIDLVHETRPINFVYASSSSVYGGIKQLPFSESFKLDNPLSLYAATKLSNELTAKAYANLYAIPAIGMRFFTVYGPNSRPDMAIFKFADLMRAGKKIPVYNGGNMIRDWTYVDDIVDGLLASLSKPESGEVYNLGRGSRERLADMITLLEEYLGIEAQRELMPMQLGDVEATEADITKARESFGYQPKVSLADGMRRFADWYQHSELSGQH